MKLSEVTGVSIKKGFEAFNSNNPEVYKAFEAQALAAVRMKKTKVSSKQILGFIRWNMFLAIDQNETFKINDAYTAHYSRLFADNHPQHAGIFNYRNLRDSSDEHTVNVLTELNTYNK
jgi:hypothetical protein|tara:strand:- start:104 stop:457 length:354 start_codon:yes stop_codon:yes gene_type:complete